MKVVYTAAMAYIPGSRRGEFEGIPVISAINEKDILVMQGLHGTESGKFIVTIPDELVGVAVFADQTTEQVTELKNKYKDIGGPINVYLQQ